MRSTFRPGLVSFLTVVLSSSVFSVPEARAATIDVSGTITASGLSFGTVMAYNPFPVYPFSNLDGGAGTATDIDGFSTLFGVSPSDLTITFGDLERVGTSFPGGCVPTGAANCPSATNNWGNTDATAPYFTIGLTGSGTILSGTLLTWATTTNTAWGPNPEFGQGSGSGLILFETGVSPYLEEVFALTGGTGLVEVSSDRFTAICSVGSDPCVFSLDATLTFVPEPTTAFMLGLGLAILGRRGGRTEKSA